MLVIVKHRDLHALAQRALDVEAVRRLDVFEVDATEGGLQRRDGVDQLVEVALSQLDVEHIDAGELLEEHRLALHHRLGCQRADVAQTEHRRAIGDHGHQIAARGVLEGVGRVCHDFLAGRCHARRVSQGQITLVDQLLRRCDGHLAGGRKLVVIERRLAQFGLLHFIGGHHGLISLCGARGGARRRLSLPNRTARAPLPPNGGVLQTGSHCRRRTFAQAGQRVDAARQCADVTRRIRSDHPLLRSPGTPRGAGHRG